MLGIPVLRGKRPFAFSQTASLGFFQWKVGETLLYIGNSKITYYNRGFRCNASILTLAVVNRLIGFIRKASRMGKREEREKEGKAMPSSTRIY